MKMARDELRIEGKNKWERKIERIKKKGAKEGGGRDKKKNHQKNKWMDEMKEIIKRIRRIMKLQQ